ncbi:hypothetical protein HGB13_05285, partial [bacterium]|nr:hypothetical protein [bacterium]
MDKKCGCRFCDIISGIYQYPDIDKPILINEDFYSIASIGSIAEGWTLIVSVRHVLSMKELYGRTGFLEIINQMLPVLIKKYGSLIAFEHGSNYDDSLTGCGINHAHLHVVPFKCSLLGDMFESEYDWVKVRPDEIIDVVGNNEYLFYKDIGLNENWLDNVGYVHVLNGEVSQY